MSWLDSLKVNCRKATYLHEKKREGKIGPLERLGLWIHLCYCSFCKMFFVQLDQLEKSSKSMADNNSTLSPSAKTAMQQAFDAEMKK